MSRKQTLTVKELAEKLDFFVRLDPDLPVEFVGDYAETFFVGDVKMYPDDNKTVFILQPPTKDGF